MQKLYRLIDANLNRSREGIRVIEDIVRFCINNKGLSRSLKKLRHDISGAVKDTDRLIAGRDSRYDVGRGLAISGGGKRLKELAVRNFRRVEESLRVLEEVHRILKPHKAEVFENLRFRAYNLEKKVYERL